MLTALYIVVTATDCGCADMGVDEASCAVANRATAIDVFAIGDILVLRTP